MGFALGPGALRAVTWRMYCVYQSRLRCHWHSTSDSDRRDAQADPAATLQARAATAGQRRDGRPAPQRAAHPGWAGMACALEDGSARAQASDSDRRDAPILLSIVSPIFLFHFPGNLLYILFYSPEKFFI